MTKRISEQDLILPALYCIEIAGEISTTDLSECLRSLLKPQGQDLEILSGRNDDKFSQKVRNLRSHETLEKDGLAIYERRGRQGYWHITDAGKSYLETNRLFLEYIIEQGYSYEVQQEALAQTPKIDELSQKEIALFDETILEKDIYIVEGKKRDRKQTTYERSKSLREYAIRYYSKDRRILCAVCDFDFESVYGEHGVGFIEIHHTKPIFSYEGDDTQKKLKTALKDVVPLCSNCHRMIHRKRDRMLTVDELREIIAKSQS